jgi:hypothetical protein
MKTDIFGNLMEWGEVLKKLMQLRDTKTLNDHQPGLARILRYRHNWRLRETVLKLIREVENPAEELFRETLHLALDEKAYPEVRVMAVQTVADLMIKNRRIYSKKEIALRCEILKKMEAMMRETHSPLLREGTERFFSILANRRVVTVE